MTQNMHIDFPGITTEVKTDECVVTWHWAQAGGNRRNGQLIASTLFLVLILAMLLPFTLELMPVLTPLICLCIIAVVYPLLARFINRTTVRASAYEIKVKQGPLPYPGNKTIARRRIRQGELSVGVKKYRANRRHRVPAGETYEVVAKIQGAQPEVLMKGILERQQAELVVQTINAFWADLENE